MTSTRRKSAPTVQDVADKAKVSVATVSRALNGVGQVREPARSKVLRAAKALNYQPSRAAQSLRAQRSLVIGLIISDIQNPFFTSVVRGIEDSVLEKGYSLVLCNSDEDPVKELRYIEVLRAERVAGVIIASTRKVNRNIDLLLDTGIPVVALDRSVMDPPIDTVQVDNTAVSRAAINHLIGLGHTRIGMLALPAVLTTGQERKRGYMQAMQAAGIMVDKRWVVHAPDPRVSGGQAAMHRLLGLTDGVSAVFVSSSLLTMGAMLSVREAGVNIPQDLSMIAFDDMTWSALISPPLTTIAQPTYSLGQRAAALLMQRMASPQAKIERIKLDASLIVRESTRAYTQKLQQYTASVVHPNGKKTNVP